MSPKILLRLVLVGLLFGGAAGCGSDTSSQSRSGTDDTPKTLSEEYWLFVHVNDFTGNYHLTVNGFPVEQEPVNVTMTDQELGARLNTALIGRGNKVSVVVEPYLRRNGTQLVVGNVDLEAWVSQEATDGSNIPLYELSGEEGKRGITEAKVDSSYKEWEERAVQRWKEYLRWEEQWLAKHPDSSSTITTKEGGALDSIEAWSDRNQLEVSTTFDNEAGPDFSRIFEEAPVIEGTSSDSARLKDYAIRLRDLLRKRKGRALFEELRPCLADRAERHGTSIESDSARAAKWVRDARTGDGWFTDVEKDSDFSRAYIRIRRWVDGRVWALSRRDGSALLGGWKIYVAEVNGTLKVVRLGA